MFKNEYPLFFIKIFINTFDPQMITPRKIIRRVIPVIIAFSVIWTVISGLMSFHAGLHKGPLEHICVFILPKKHNENIPFSVNDLNNTTLISIGSSKVDFCIILLYRIVDLHRFYNYLFFFDLLIILIITMKDGMELENSIQNNFLKYNYPIMSITLVL